MHVYIFLKSDLRMRQVLPYFGTNFMEWLKIQKRDPLPPGPSPTNSWPSPLPHFPQLTWKISQFHILVTKCDFFLIENGKNNFREQLSPLPLSTDGIILLVMDAGTQKLSFRHPKTFPEMMASWTRIFFSLFLPNFWCTCSILKIILNMANIWQKMKKILVQHIIFNPLFYGSSKTQVLGTQIHHYKILYMYI